MSKSFGVVNLLTRRAAKVWGTVWICVQCGKKNDACFLENSNRGQEESGERVEIRSVQERGVSVKKVGQVDK